MKATKDQVESFLSQPHIAIAGYSRSKSKFGTVVFQTLQEKGYKVYPLNPAGGTTPDGQLIYEHVNQLPEQVKALLIITKPEVTETLLDQALQRGLTHFWVQQFSESPQLRQRLADQPNIVWGQCVLMHAQPSGLHKFHRWLMKQFRLLPA